ncbi:MAG TPA: hypothetical protein VH088_03650, partial [Terriglobales bacterium]|nr:hypothetical protein [Terriglobales bacterium]
MKRNNRKIARVGLLLCTFLLLSGVHQRVFSAANDASQDAAVKQVVAGFSNGWNGHDAAMMC